jgi:acetyl-CoA acetyltransferase
VSLPQIIKAGDADIVIAGGTENKRRPYALTDAAGLPDG